MARVGARRFGAGEGHAQLRLTMWVAWAEASALSPRRRAGSARRRCPATTCGRARRSGRAWHARRSRAGRAVVGPKSRESKSVSLHSILFRGGGDLLERSRSGLISLEHGSGLTGGEGAVAHKEGEQIVEVIKHHHFPGLDSRECLRKVLELKNVSNAV